MYPYYFPWKNNEKRQSLHGRRFRILARGKMNSVLIEFRNGQREVISRNAIRKFKGEVQHGK
jgi:hypothetical protein